jgi:hypothetical protein
VIHYELPKSIEGLLLSYETDCKRIIKNQGGQDEIVERPDVYYFTRAKISKGQGT